MKKSEKTSVGSVKLEPLKSKHFDMGPAKTGKRGPVFNWTKDFQRFLAMLGAVFLIFMASYTYIRGKNVLKESQELASSGLTEFEKGIDHLLNFNPQQATRSFEQAQKTFRQLQFETAFLTQNANQLGDKKLYLDTANTLVEVALKVTDLGKKLSDLVAGAPTFFKTIFSPEGQVMMSLIHTKGQELDQLINLGGAIQRQLASIDLDILPEDFQPKMKTARQQIGLFLSTLLAVKADLDAVSQLLGDRVPHRYLVLLQNNHEIRATGGFIGSYVIVDVNDGKIIKMEAKDVYESDGQLATQIQAPPGIDRLTDRLYMRDANYSPDFPTSAQSIMWLLEQSNGPSVDTVVALDQTLIEGILEITGPLQVSGLPFVLEASNFSQIISFYTEAKLSETNTPKQLLFDLIPHFKMKVTQFSDLPQILNLVKRMIDEGHLQIYSRDESVQHFSEKYGLTGQVVPPAQKIDYLSVISTSIGGNKSDEFIQAKLNHTTIVDGSGGVVNELKIEKKHTYSQEDRARVEFLIQRYSSGKTEKEKLHQILGAGGNLDFMRVYVPLGSELQGVTGIDIKSVKIFEDLDYTVYAFVFGPVAPGDDKTIRLRYKLPFKLSTRPGDNYRFLAQKQAGTENIHLIKSIQVTNPLYIKRAYPDFQGESIFSPVIDGPFKADQFFISAIVKE